MKSNTWHALKEDIARIIPIIARRNNCMEDDVINVMNTVVSERIKD